MKRFLLLLLAAALACTSLQCFLTKTCLEVGCLSGASFTSTLPVATADLRDLVVTVCRNAECSSGTPTVTSNCGSGARGCPANVVLNVQGPLRVDVFLSGQGTPDDSGGLESFASYSLSVDVEAPSNAERDSLADGDVYRFTARRSDGSTPLDLTLTATTYAKDYPNGESCDGPNGYCRHATLD